jgi:hypothetical protein
MGAGSEIPNYTREQIEIERGMIQDFNVSSSIRYLMICIYYEMLEDEEGPVLHNPESPGRRGRLGERTKV